MASAQEKLKNITAQRKELAKEQKAIKEQLDKTKDERAQAKKAQAAARKEAAEAKSNLLKLTSQTYTTFSKGSVEEIEALANGIEEHSQDLIGAIKSFAVAARNLDELLSGSEDFEEL